MLFLTAAVSLLIFSSFTGSILAGSLPFTSIERVTQDKDILFVPYLSLKSDNDKTDEDCDDGDVCNGQETFDPTSEECPTRHSFEL